MDNDAKNRDGITWTRKKEWGSDSLTHRTELLIGGTVYKFAIDQPRKGFWTVRGWADGEFHLYRDGRTLGDLKEVVACEMARLGTVAAAGAEAEADGYGEPDLAEAKSEARDSEHECWCEYVDIGVGMQRVTQEPGCPEHDQHPEPGPDDYCANCHELNYVCGGTCTQRALAAWDRFREQFKALTPIAIRSSAAMRHLMWLLAPPCGCPTPTHRMDCGVGATPKVVTK